MAGHAQWPEPWGGMPPFANDPGRACKDANPSVFFAEGAGAIKATATARKICRDCPLLRDCQAFAIPQPSLRGVWGGLTEQDRERVRAGAPVPDVTAARRPPVTRTQTTRTLAVIAHQVAMGLTVDEIVALSPHNRKTVLRHLHKVRDVTGQAPPGFPKSPGKAA